MIRFEDQTLQHVHNRRSTSTAGLNSPAVGNHFANSPQVSVGNSNHNNGSNGNKIPNFLTASSTASSITSSAAQFQGATLSPGYFGQQMAPKTPGLNTPSMFPMSPAAPMSSVGGRVRSPSTSVAFPGNMATPNPGDLSGLFCRRQHSSSGMMGAVSPAPSMCLGGGVDSSPPTSPTSFYIAPERVEAENWIIAENFADDSRSLITDRLRRCGDVIKTDFSLTSNRVYVRFANANQARSAITLFGSGTTGQVKQQPDKVGAVFTVRPMDDMKFVESQLATGGGFDYKKVSPVFTQGGLPKQLRFRRALSVSDEMQHLNVMNGGGQQPAQPQTPNGQFGANGSLPRNGRNEPPAVVGDSLLNRFLLFWFGLADQGDYVTGGSELTLPVTNEDNLTESRTMAGLKNFGAVPPVSRSRIVAQPPPANKNTTVIAIASAILLLALWVIFL